MVALDVISDKLPSDQEGTSRTRIHVRIIEADIDIEKNSPKVSLTSRLLVYIVKKLFKGYVAVFNVQVVNGTTTQADSSGTPGRLQTPQALQA